jgi:hypothetical protein
MTRPWTRYAWLLAFAAATMGCGAVRTSHETSSRVDPALADFYVRVERYVALRDDARQQVPALRTQAAAANQTPNQDARDALAQRIQRERADAGQGDIFTTDIAATVRTRLNVEIRGSSASATRDAIREDGPAPFALRVNGKYPEGASLPTMPGAVLAALPALPPGLEYRIVDAHLILRDTEANLVVDYLRDVMCRSC